MMTHVDDGALVRYLDDECEAPERAAVREHLDACTPCAERLARLGRRSALVTTALRAADVAPRASRRGAPSRALRAAAAVLVLLGVGGAVRPVRAWIVERAQTWWAALAGRGPEAGPAPSPAADTRVAFVPAGDAFTLEITAWQAGGTLTLETVPGDTAAATVEGSRAAEDLTVLPAGLHIRNGATSTASYRLRLPARITQLRVRLAGVEVSPAWQGNTAALSLRRP